MTQNMSYKREIDLYHSLVTRFFRKKKVIKFWQRIKLIAYDYKEQKGKKCGEVFLCQKLPSIPNNIGEIMGDLPFFLQHAIYWEVSKYGNLHIIITNYPEATEKAQRHHENPI